jgi:hypothetical protein
MLGHENRKVDTASAAGYKAVMSSITFIQDLGWKQLQIPLGRAALDI